MVSFSKQLTDKQVSFIKNKLKKYQLPSKNKYAVFYADYLQTKIFIYTSKKILIQGKNVERVCEYLTIRVNNKGTEPLTDCSFVGCDEVGTGDYFGGIVCSACYLNKKDEQKVKELGVADSKTLSDEQIINITNKIYRMIDNQEIDCWISTVYIPPSLYNQMYKNTKNANMIKTICHNMALENLKKWLDDHDIKDYKVVLDEYVNKSKYDEYTKLIKRELKGVIKNIVPIDIFTPNAESKYVCVALASMSARTRFLYEMDGLSKKLKMKLPLGSSNDEIKKVAYSIDDKTLPNYAKTNFNIFKKIN